MKKFLSTSIEFIKHIGTTGAITETSRFVEDAITEYVKIDAPQILVEFGGGHGNITRAILKKMHPQSLLYSFEVKDEFIPILSQIADNRLKIIHGSATDVVKYTGIGKADCVISSLPFTIIPKEIGQEIQQQAIISLKPEGSFHQVLYSVQSSRFERFFPETHVKPVLNFPIAFVHHCFKNAQVRKRKK